MPEPAAQSPARPLRLAMLGMIAGNGHPYSWSAIINGYDRTEMARCPYAAIPGYLGAQPHDQVRVPGVQVTHLWTDNPDEAPAVARASLIPHIVKKPEDVIGEVDAVLIATDDGADHVRRARPFVEAGLPVFVDKPLATTLEELRQFIQWERAGARLLSSSGLRYAPELARLVADRATLGEIRWMSLVTAKTWERYGIHVLEPAFVLLGPGFLSVRLESRPGLEVAHLVHRSGAQVTLPVIYDGGATFGTVHVCGTAGQSHFRFTDTYTAFRNQLLSYIDFVRTGRVPHPFHDTIEMMTILIAGILSRQENSRSVALEEIKQLLQK